MATYTGIKKIKIGDNVFELAVDWSAVTSKPTIPSAYSLPLATSGTRGGIQIGYSSSGQNYAVKLSSEKAYVTVPWTDVNVTSTTVTDSTTMYLTGSTSNSTNTGTLSKHASASLYFTKDSNNAGGTTLKLGNNIASGTAGAKYGDLVLYGSTAYSVDIKTESGQPTANRTMYLPSYAGTMYLTCTSTTDAVGGATTAPVYVDNTGRIQAVTSIPYSLLTGTPTITDEQVKIEPLTQNAYYYPVLAQAEGVSYVQIDSELQGFKYSSGGGTTNGIGSAALMLGNTTPSGTVGNQQGNIFLYGKGAYYTQINTDVISNNKTITFPNSSGTVALRDDIPATAEQIGINFEYTTSGNNRAVQQDANGNLYVTQKDDNTTYSAGTGLSLSSTTFSVKTGFTTSGNSRKVQTDSNGNLYVIQKDTNTYVTQTGDSTATWRKVLGTYNGASAVTTTVSNATNLAYFDADGPAFNTSTGELYTKGYYMYLATNDALYTAINDLSWVDSVIS